MYGLVAVALVSKWCPDSNIYDLLHFFCGMASDSAASRSSAG